MVEYVSRQTGFTSCPASQAHEMACNRRRPSGLRRLRVEAHPLPARHWPWRQRRTGIVCSPTQVDVWTTEFAVRQWCESFGATDVKAKRPRLRNAEGRETTRVLPYALRALTRRGETGMSKRDVFRLLCQAFSRAMLNPRG